MFIKFIYNYILVYLIEKVKRTTNNCNSHKPQYNINKNKKILKTNCIISRNDNNLKNINLHHYHVSKNMNYI